MLTAPARQRVRLTRAEKWTVVGASWTLLALMQLGVLLDLNIWKTLGIAIGGTVFVIAYRRPMGNMQFLMIWLPLGPFILIATRGYLGVPSAIIKNGTYLRFMMVAALLAAAARARQRRGDPLDVIDRLAIGYMTIVLFYALITPWLTDAHLLIYARMQGLQALTLFVAGFTAVRWLRPSPAEAERLRQWAYWVVLVIGVVGIYQKLDPGGMRVWMVQHFDLNGYYKEVAQLSGPGLNDVIQHYWLEPVRVSSLMLSPFDFADLMLVAAALAIEGLTRRFRPLDLGLLVIAALGIFFSGTRINLVAIGAMVVIAAFRSMTTEIARVRFLALGMVMAIAVMPLVLGSRLVKGDTVSNEGHVNELTTSVETIIDQPLGGGVGNDGAYTRKFASVRSLVSGNTVLGIGIQIGAFGMFVFVAFLIVVLLRTRAGSSLSPPNDVALARFLLFGGIVSGLTHNAWTAYGPGTFAWVLTALGCGVAVTRPSANVPHPSGPGLPR